MAWPRSAEKPLPQDSERERERESDEGPSGESYCHVHRLGQVSMITIFAGDQTNRLLTRHLCVCPHSAVTAHMSSTVTH
ncbi:hypothetical protein C4D60_Mb08t33130 [Musa balbisiana]|uniref:Uncharacterized protein n=1 Tax=Musa balbisiana TaxID=52838 RepID=A0A4S8K892_MUSBA|nr:hypothetical protein C4D60_Mb08t33130 [Musa balbisiana]